MRREHGSESPLRFLFAVVVLCASVSSRFCGMLLLCAVSPASSVNCFTTFGVAADCWPFSATIVFTTRTLQYSAGTTGVGCSDGAAVATALSTLFQVAVSKVKLTDAGFVPLPLFMLSISKKLAAQLQCDGHDFEALVSMWSPTLRSRCHPQVDVLHCANVVVVSHRAGS